MIFIVSVICTNSNCNCKLNKFFEKFKVCPICRCKTLTKCFDFCLLPGFWTSR